jgi:hypothetical protein
MLARGLQRLRLRLIDLYVQVNQCLKLDIKV